MSRFCTISPTGVIQQGHKKMTDDISYFSVENQVTVKLKIKRSEFICTLGPAQNLSRAKEFISAVSGTHKTATHNCWAYAVGDKARICHSSDAGEPSGTAGKPMLGVFRRHRLTHVAAVVTRYYGGVKLGVRGLMDAYSKAVDDAVSLAVLKQQVETIRLHIHVAYEVNEALIRRLKQFHVEFKKNRYDAQVEHTADVAVTDKMAVLALLDQYRAVGRLTYRIL